MSSAAEWPINNPVPALLPIVLLSLIWGIGPALPALFDGHLLGHGFTDLYPSVWGLWAFSEAQPGLPNHTALLGHPVGMGYYYSSPIKGWLATPLIPLFGLTATWNALLLTSRVATIVCAWRAGLAWNLGRNGALAAAALYGCSPFFHGYAVEGIVEGTDGWTLALWVWALGAQRYRLAAVPFALTLLSSWYLGMAACLLAALAALRDKRALWSGFGLVLAAPALVQFASAFPESAPIDAGVRAAMGATIGLPNPGIREGLNPFAINAYIGFIAMGAALLSRTRWAALAVIPALLSLGIGPVYDLPVAELVRFPYRWHAATLVLLAPAVAITANRLRWGIFLGPLIALEGFLLSPVEPVIPGAEDSIPEYATHVTGPVLNIPGPLAMPPGVTNRSRLRAKYLMHHQTAHGQPSAWTPDFNGVGTEPSPHAESLQAFTRFDPLSSGTPTHTPPSPRELGVETVVVHGRELGAKATQSAIDFLEEDGWTAVHEKDRLWVFHSTH